MTATSECVHATAVALGERAALIRGASGSGKSDLALRCLSLAPSALLALPALLVADDQVRLHTLDGKVIASAPQGLESKLEVRGIGIMRVPSVPRAEVALIVELVAREAVDRLPDPWPVAVILGHSFPLLRLWAFDASAPIKLHLALASPQLPPASNLT